MQRTTCNARWRGARRQQLLSDEPLSPLSSDGPCCYRRRPAERTPRASYCNSRETSAAHSGTTRSDSKAHRLVGRDVRRLLVAVVPAARTVGHVAAPGRSRPPPLALYIAVRCRPTAARLQPPAALVGMVCSPHACRTCGPCRAASAQNLPCRAMPSGAITSMRLTRWSACDAFRTNGAKCAGGGCAHCRAAAD
jgi:hypothetical protein